MRFTALMVYWRLIGQGAINRNASAPSSQTVKFSFKALLCRQFFLLYHPSPETANVSQGRRQQSSPLDSGVIAV